MATGVILALVALAPAAHGLRSDPPIKATPDLDEVDPAVGGGDFAWSQRSLLPPGAYSIFATEYEGATLRVNPVGTQARAGGIWNGVLVYQQWRGARSDLKLFNFRTKRRSNPPRGVNTRHWEVRPSLSGDWLLFNRLDTRRAIEHLLLRNLRTGEQRNLLTVDRRPRFPLAYRAVAGQVNGNYVVATHCRARCRVRFYGIRERTWIPLRPQSVIPESQDYAPSVTDQGTVFFARSFTFDRCMGETLILQVPLHADTAKRVTSVPDGLGVETTYMSTYEGWDKLYYTRGSCRRGGADIYGVFTNPR